MKLLSAAAILMMSVHETQSIRFFDLPAEENQSLAEVKNMSKVDKELLDEIDTTLDQAQRNADQGELGRTLAMNKVNQIKMSLE